MRKSQKNEKEEFWPERRRVLTYLGVAALTTVSGFLGCISVPLSRYGTNLEEIERKAKIQIELPKRIPGSELFAYSWRAAKKIANESANYKLKVEKYPEPRWEKAELELRSENKSYADFIILIQAGEEYNQLPVLARRYYYGLPEVLTVNELKYEEEVILRELTKELYWESGHLIEKIEEKWY